MDLKSGPTLWTKQNPRAPRYPPLHTNIFCDVAIIGAGITGALVAHELVKSGRKIVVIDKRAPGTGSTSASTGLLLYETDLSLAELARRHGRRTAVRSYVLGRCAIREIGEIVRTLGIDCGFSKRKSLYLASDRQGLAEIKREYRLRRLAHMRVAFLTRSRLRAEFGLDFPGALYSPGCAQIDAAGFVQRLLAHHVRRRAIEVFQNTRVIQTKADAAGVWLRTATGHVIEARHVVVATGYEAAPFLRKKLVRLNSSYVVASRPLPGKPPWKEGCLIWETMRPYHYLRTTADHRIMIGGEDEPFADPRRRDAKLAAKARTLVRRFRQLFPLVPFKREFAWCGTFGESGDGLPYVGALGSAPQILYALGYGGNGITFSQVAAKIIGRLCAGRKHRDAALFRFGRENNEDAGTTPLPGEQ